MIIVIILSVKLKIYLMFRFILFLVFFLSLSTYEKSYGQKIMKIGGKYFKCKAPKNSFEKTRGVRNRICIFSKKDKEIINEMIMQKKNER